MNELNININSVFEYLSEEGPVVFLESQLSDHPSSNRSFLAARPLSWIKAHGSNISVMQNGRVKNFRQNPWNAFKSYYSKQDNWLFGYFGYDLKNFSEDLKSENKDLIEAPDLFFMNPGLLVEWKDGQKIIHRGSAKDLQNIEQNVHPVSKAIHLEIRPSVSENEYKQKIESIKNDIYEGAYYEINYSHPLIYGFEGKAAQLYDRMRAAGPVPFGAYMDIGDIQVCCSSPERFLAKKGNAVWSQPIKGTRKRDQENDQVQIQSLINSEKDRAENLMIVDLVRNDLSRIGKEGSVKTENLFEIQSFETVHQMVSTVRAEVNDHVHPVDIIRNCFPMGSMTGAPKIAAMQSIEIYESYKRGIYSGSIGYFNPEGDFDFNVVIRSAIINGKTLVYPVGGAITSDSESDLEWEETHIKARALTNI